MHSVTYVYVAGFKVLRMEDLVVKGMERAGVGDTIVDFPEWAKVDVASPPCHLALSSDDLTLSVCITRAAGVFALMFDIRAFAIQVNVSVRACVRDMSYQDCMELLITGQSLQSCIFTIYKAIFNSSFLIFLSVTIYGNIDYCFT